MSHLTEAITYLESKFPSEWWENYSFHIESNTQIEKENKIILFTNDLIEIEIKVFEYLNFSVLEGEYITEINIKETLNKISAAVLPVTIVPPEDDIQEVVFVNGFANFQSTLKDAINIYIEFISNIQIGFDLSNSHKKEYIFSYAETHNIGPEFFWISPNLKLFQINILTAECDHFLSTSRLSLLISLSEKIETLKESDAVYRPLIKWKCDFLKSKILFRYRLDTKLENEDEPKPAYIINNGKELPVAASTFNDAVFDDWLSYLEVHYQLISGWEAFIREDFQLDLDIPLNECTIIQLHRRIKYYKDVNRKFPESIDNIRVIRNEFERRLSDANAKNNEFLIYCYSVDLIYAINNEFSLICEEKNPECEFELVNTFYNKIVDLEDKIGVKNFFPQTKYLQYLLRLLEKNNNLDSVKDNRKIIITCNSLFKKYEENLDWSKKHYRYVFQLPFKECFPASKKIFVYSSFLLPLTKNKIHEEFIKNKNLVEQKDASIKLLENIEDRMGTLYSLNEKISKFSTDIKDKEFRAIEVIGVFTAIISFVAASLPTFKFVKTSLDAALYSLALSTSFSVFVLLLLSAFRGPEKLREYKKILIYGGFATLTLWVATICLSTYFKAQEKESSTNKNSISNNVIVSPTDINSQTVPSRTITKATNAKPQCDCPPDTIKKGLKK